MRDAIEVAPAEAARGLYCDDPLYSRGEIRALLDLVGDAHMK